MRQVKLTFLIIIGVLILGVSIYVAYRNSQSRAGNIIIPAGTTYLGPTLTSAPSTPIPTKDSQPPTAPLRFSAASDVTWRTQSGRIYPYSISFPTTLPLTIFPDDETDSVAISWGNIPPQKNILLNIEFIDKRDPGFLGKPKVDYVKNWYKFFSGLKGVDKVEPLTNASGMHGYKASYINYASISPNVDIFFEIPGTDNMMIHMANGVLDPAIFNKIVESLKWISPTPKK